VKLRRATIEDAAMLLRWRNDPATREASINTDIVSLDAHIVWLRASFENPTRTLLIAETDVPVGTVRIDQSAEGAELSWTVAPEARGRGYGMEMVRLALPMSGRVFAQIKGGNIASQKIAKAAGFSLGEDGDFQRWELGMPD
jgi:RimJ/RimL family protein N-acetyltransferase